MQSDTTPHQGEQILVQASPSLVVGRQEDQRRRERCRSARRTAENSLVVGHALSFGNIQPQEEQQRRRRRPFRGGPRHEGVGHGCGTRRPGEVGDQHRGNYGDENRRTSPSDASDVSATRDRPLWRFCRQREAAASANAKAGTTSTGVATELAMKQFSCAFATSARARASFAPDSSVMSGRNVTRDIRILPSTGPRWPSASSL